MPIRFRCAYCNQLMGIARRKAGTVVRCPKCAGQVIVPAPVPELVPAEPAGAPGPALFEESDFDQLFEASPPLVPSPPVQPLPPVVNPLPRPAAPPPPLAGAGFDVQPVNLSPAANYQTPGIFLTPVKLTILCVAVVVLLGLSFFLGLLVGGQ